MRLETRAVRAARGQVVTESPFEKGQPHVPLIDLSTTYTFERSSAVAESMDALIEGVGEAPNPVYARLRNPTVAGFENALADLESAEAAVAFASGMAAITAMVLAAGSEAAPEGWARGSHIVAIRPIYGGTDHLLATGILGTEVTWAEPDEVAESLREDTSQASCPRCERQRTVSDIGSRWRSTTLLPPRSFSARWNSVQIWSCTAPPNSLAVMGT